MPKFYTCCVPTCETRGPIQDFYRFPGNPYDRQTWMRAIPDLDTVIDHKSVICLKHFKSSVLKTFDPKADIITVLPTIFEKKSDDASKKKLFPKYMFELMKRDIAPETFGDCEGQDAEDFIIEFCFLKSVYADRLGSVMKEWQVSFTDTQAFFYKLSLDHIAKIKCSIKVNNELKVEVMLSGRQMDPLDLTWAIPASCKITRWSQLKALLCEIGGSKLLRVK
ncbi:hypothetical protein JTB14_002610 [Gonioctena quinquepunctata]|nr:hypothetical protein JTB14_002610 [Gonioctena quinquepunctata]